MDKKNKDFPTIDIGSLNKSFEQLKLEYEQNKRVSIYEDSTENSLSYENKPDIYEFSSNINNSVIDLKPTLKPEDEKNTNFDIDLVNKSFEQLKLEYEQNKIVSYYEDSTENCCCCKNKSKVFESSSNINHAVRNFKTTVKLEDEKNTYFSENNLKEDFSYKEKHFLPFIKEEEINDDVDSESLNESFSSDDENYTVLLERGGKAKKQRSHNEIGCVSRAYDKRKLCSSTSSVIQRNCSTPYRIQTNSISIPISTRNVTKLNNRTRNFDNQHTSSINSPESRYETSRSSVLSPSSVIDDQNEEQRKINEIYTSISDSVESFLQNSYNPNKSCSDIGKNIQSNIISIPTSTKNATKLNNHVRNFDNQHTLGINSPESGYETSWSSILSPSPPSSVIDDQNEEQRRINEIYTSISDSAESFLQNSNNANKSCSDIGKSIDAVCKSFKHASVTNSDYYNVSPVNFQVPNTSSLIDPVREETNLGKSVASGLVLETATNQNPVLLKNLAQENIWKRKITYYIKNTAKRNLKNPEVFCMEKYRDEVGNMLRKIKCQTKKNEEVKIIDFDNREKYQNLLQSILHSAVIERKVEKVCCIIETLKCYHHALFDINNRDANKKTALDYAIKQNMPLLVEYLKENTAVPSVEC